jgi:hypothetical protein
MAQCVAKDKALDVLSSDPEGLSTRCRHDWNLSVPTTKLKMRLY